MSHALPGEDPRLLASSLSTEAAVEAQLLGQRAAPCKWQRPEGQALAKGVQDKGRCFPSNSLKHCFKLRYS